MPELTLPEITLPEVFDPVITRLEGWLETGVSMLPDLAVALIVMAIGFAVGVLTRRAAVSTLHRVSDNRQVAALLGRLVFLGMLSVGAFLALGVLGLDKTVTSLLAGAGVLGLALGFAAQKLAANLMSGVLIAVRRPFRIGEWIETEGAVGRVEQVDLNVCTLRTADGRMLRIPNRTLLDSPLTNLSRFGQRRVELTVGCAYGDDPTEAISVTRQALSDLPGACADREVEVFATAFGGSAVELVARVWFDWSTPTDDVAARSEMLTRIHAAWGDAGLTIPFPIRTLDLGGLSGLLQAGDAQDDGDRRGSPLLRALVGQEEDDPDDRQDQASA